MGEELLDDSAGVSAGGAVLEQPRSSRLFIEVQSAADLRERLIRDVRAGFGARPLSVASRWLYDARGSALFEELARQPEHYLARAELTLVARAADELIAVTQPEELVEVGRASAPRSRLLLDAVSRGGLRPRLVAIDAGKASLLASAAELAAEHPWLAVSGVVDDWERGLARLDPGPRRLVVLAGGALGTLSPSEATRLLTDCARLAGDEDHLLIGCDLAKPVEVVEAAYRDAAGAAAAFNLNLLRVLDEELGADFEPARFRHRAAWSPVRSQIELSLVSDRAQVVTIPPARLRVRLSEGDAIRTEIHRTFTREAIEALLAVCGFAVMRWWEEDGVALALAARK